MGEKSNGWNDFYVNRLDFLKYSLATSVAVWAGSTIPRGLGIDDAEAQELFSVTSTSDPSSMFPQSVASGDPRPNGVVLWTRITPQTTAARVAFQISATTSFDSPLVSGIVDTSSARDWTVKTQVNNAALRPNQRYFYRFIYNGVASRTGRFKCLPAPNQVLNSVRLAYISCQDYTNGYYNALYHLSRENVDYVVHLGDYTYETVGSESFQGGGPPERQFTFPDGGEEELTLKDYRFTYKKYKTDRNLQAVHEKFAFITIWDDHEFANDAHQISAPDQGGNQAGDKRNPARREAANRAWAEYTPVGVPYDAAKDPLNEIRIYRTFEFGNLLTLVMTDERLYRDGPPNGNETQNRYVTPGAGQEGQGEEAPGRTMLGTGTPGENGLSRPNQLSYFLQKITGSSKTWKIWGNEVTFMQFKLANASLGIPETVLSLEELFPGIEDFPAAGAVGAPEGVYVTLDQWDGYQAERRRITQRVREGGVSNFVTITGDIHSYLAGYIKENYDESTCTGNNRPVGVELVCGSVTSSNLTEIATFGFGSAPAPDVGQFTAQVTANNNHIKYFNSNDHGYNLLEITPSSIRCTMKAVRVIAPDAENRGSAIKESDPNNTRAVVLRRFRVPAIGSTFNGASVTEPLIIDETNSAAPVPLACSVPAPSPGPGGV